jgi:hypothetical protein
MSINKAHYSVDTLRLFDRYDRTSWEQTFGEQAPPWDSTRLTKNWIDPEADELNPRTYITYDVFNSTARKFEKLRINAREAATPNLKGKNVYPDYKIDSTQAVVMDPRAGELPVDIRLLSYRMQAEELAKELSATIIIGTPSPLYETQWRGEIRRKWLLRLDKGLHNVGLLLNHKYINGVGAPGTWKIQQTGERTWIPERPPTGENVRGEVPIPCRLLAENEALYLDHPMKVSVYRTDISGPFNQPSVEDSIASLMVDVATMKQMLSEMHSFLLELK